MPAPDCDHTLSSLSWRALGTYVFLATRPRDRLAEARCVAEEVLAAVDRTCSRFRNDSDLSRANAHPGQWVAVDPLLVAAVRVAVEAAETTRGLVDPCLGRAMVELGYDADLGVVVRRPPTRGLPETPTPRFGAWEQIGLSEQAVRVPHGCALDLGATAKAWASDLVAAEVTQRLGCDVVVSVGGDVRVNRSGMTAAADPGWPVAVTERPDDGDGEVVVLDGGGLATSSTTVRRWSSRGAVWHHVLDPRTALPVPGPWRTATATGPTCVAANTATTAALVLGAEAVPWLAERSVAARLVASDGAVTTVGGWPTTGGATWTSGREPVGRS